MRDQIVVLTNPQIGNYGTNAADNEASRPYIEGLVTREFSPISSNWRSQQVTEEYLERFNVPVIAEIDTRAVVRHLRTHGALRGVISSLETDPQKLVEKARNIRKMDGTDLAKVVSTKSLYEWDCHDRRNFNGDPLLQGDESLKLPPPDLHVVAYDFGIKHNILRMLSREACRVTVVPAETSAEDVLALNPDGIFLSNGPGDPEPVTYAQQNIRKLAGKKPMFGICPWPSADRAGIGWQDVQVEVWPSRWQSPGAADRERKVEITAHNHNYAVDPDSINQSEVELTHIDLNDNTLEGLRHRTMPLFSVQYHPEASPGPHDSNYLFKDFRKMMKSGRSEEMFSAAQGLGESQAEGLVAPPGLRTTGPRLSHG